MDYLRDYKEYLPNFNDWTFPTMDELVDEVKTFPNNLATDIRDATDPDAHEWEKRTTPKFFIAILVLYGIISYWTLPKIQDGRPNFYFHRGFLTFQILSIVVNLSLLLSPTFIEWSRTKILHLMGALALDREGTVTFLCIYVGLRFAWFANTFHQLVRKDVNPRGRTLKLFHVGMVPVHAWIWLKFYPGNQLAFMMMIDLVFDCVIHLYSILERMYRNSYPETFETAAGSVCAIQILMYALALLRLNSIVEGEQQNSAITAAFVGWLCVYLGVSLVCLSIVFAGMLYIWRGQDVIHYEATF